MQTVAYPYQPVPERGTLACFLVALVMHLLLGALLYYGVHWRSTAPEGVAAELWEPVPDITQPEIVPKPSPSVKPEEEQNADISLQEKARKARREAADAAQREAQAREEAAKRDAQREAQRKATEAQREASNAQRKSELARLQGLAGGAAANTGTGTSGKPSSGYAERVRQRVKPNITFTEDVPGNPAAVVSVRMAPDGSVLSARLSKSSGNAGWDNAVLRAVSLSNPLPTDTNGLAPSEIRITFWPKDQGG